MALNNGYVYRETLAATAGKDTLTYLADKYRHSTRAQWAERLARGEVHLDGTLANGTERPSAGQLLTWSRPPWEEAEAPTQFETVFEDAHLLAVVKPSGLPTLPSGGFLMNTLLRRVQARWADAVPLHRLGRATSGLVLFARNPAAAAALSADWREGAVEKQYRALSEGQATQDCYEIRAPIGLVPHPLLGTVHGALSSGKPSWTTATTLELRDHHTLFNVHIHTGRSEQIRIHLAFIGHPLVGDPMFAAGGIPRKDAPGLPGDGGYWLHAERLTFTHPVSKERLQLRARPPPALLLRTETSEDTPT